MTIIILSTLSRNDSWGTTAAVTFRTCTCTRVPYVRETGMLCYPADTLGLTACVDVYVLNACLPR